MTAAAAAPAPTTKGRWGPFWPLLLAAAGGALAAAAFPPFGFWPGVFGWGVLMRQIDRAVGPRRLGRAFALGWIAGTAYFLISTWWVGEAFLVDAAAHGWQAPFAVGFLAAGLGLLWGAAGAVYRLLAPRGRRRALVFAAVFALEEWLRGHVLTGFPWDLPGEVWPAGSAMSQGAALIGVYGMSLATLAIAATPGLFGEATLRRFDGGDRAAAALAVFGLVGLYAFGSWRLAGAPAPAPGGLTVRLVQANIPQAEKWSPQALQSIILRYVALTAKPARRPADVVLWPEGAIPLPQEYLLAPGSWSRMAIEDSLRPGQVLLMGTDRSDGDLSQERYYNSLLALKRTEEGLQVLGVYDKHHLVPFGEYMPFDQLAGRIGFKALVHVGDGFSPGPPPVALRLAGFAPFQPLICYESLFPSSFARSGPRPAWIANISNDAWFGNTSGPWQNLNLSSYRAIEEGLPMVRATPTGVSAVVDAYGRSTARLGIGLAGDIDATLPSPLAPTPYTRWRDLPFWILCAAAGACALRSGFGASRRGEVRAGSSPAAADALGAGPLSRGRSDEAAPT